MKTKTKVAFSPNPKVFDALQWVAQEARGVYRTMSGGVPRGSRLPEAFAALDKAYLEPLPDAFIEELAEVKALLGRANETIDEVLGAEGYEATSLNASDCECLSERDLKEGVVCVHVGARRLQAEIKKALHAVEVHADGPARQVVRGGRAQVDRRAREDEGAEEDL